MTNCSATIRCGRVAEVAMEARSYLESRVGGFLVHFDTDVIDFVDFPAADVLQPKQGMTFADAFAALEVFCVSPMFSGLVVTESNPNHDDENRTLAIELIEALAHTLRLQ